MCATGLHFEASERFSNLRLLDWQFGLDARRPEPSSNPQSADPDSSSENNMGQPPGPGLCRLHAHTHAVHGANHGLSTTGDELSPSSRPEAGVTCEPTYGSQVGPSSPPSHAETQNDLSSQPFRLRGAGVRTTLNTEVKNLYISSIEMKPFGIAVSCGGDIFGNPAAVLRVA